MTSRELFNRRVAARATRTVEIDGQEVRLQALTFAERAEIQSMYRDERGQSTDDNATQKRQALYVARSVVDAAGQREWSDSEADLAVLMGLPSLDMDLLNDAIMALNFAPAEAASKNLKPPTNG